MKKLFIFLLAFSVYGDEIIRYVNTASAPGGDGTTNDTTGANRAYASLVEWEADEQTDLTTGPDTMIVYCSGTAADGGVGVSGWTVSESAFVYILTTLENRHSGVWTEDKYRIETTGGISIYENYTRIEGIQIKLTSSTANKIGIYGTGGVTDGTISHCIIRAVFSGSGDGYAIALEDSDWKIYNNIIYDWINGATDCLGLWTAGNGGTCAFYNNTVYNCRRGIRSINANNGPIARNNIVYDCSAEDYYIAISAFPAASDYNVSSDTTAPGGNSRINQAVTFVDSANDNFLLASTDTAAIGYGVDLSGDGTLAFNNDIQSQTRPETWDIGADQYCVTAYDTTCLSNDSAAIDSIVCGDTTRIDTVVPTIDTTVVGGDSIQLTISACDGDTTALDTFFVASTAVNIYDKKAIKEDIRNRPVENKAIIKDKRDELFY